MSPGEAFVSDTTGEPAGSSIRSAFSSERRKYGRVEKTLGGRAFGSLSLSLSVTNANWGITYLCSCSLQPHGIWAGRRCRPHHPRVPETALKRLPPNHQRATCRGRADPSPPCRCGQARTRAGPSDGMDSSPARHQRARNHHGPERPQAGEGVPMSTTHIGIDLAKSVFEVAISHTPGRVDQRHRLSRALPPLLRAAPARRGAAGNLQLRPLLGARTAGARPPRRAPAGRRRRSLPRRQQDRSRRCQGRARNRRRARRRTAEEVAPR
ncbi:MAG: hypothetical protein KatS3mg082_3269 [Nitrospiraceae bacterium]|nr:MAG: hypothetical protein KatS3mg081_1380 [Gemmatimonadales bacterium]GIW56865.1 MAG: hypothetical protein KatS3mg082_3269 [Nitrospiraceae bacterium]